MNGMYHRSILWNRISPLIHFNKRNNGKNIEYVSEADKTEVNSTNVTSKIIFPNTSKPNDKKSMIHLIESSTKDKIESTDFSCKKCKLVNLLCKACITKTKKKQKIIVNTIKRSFPGIYHRFIKIFVASAIFDVTKIV